MLRVGRVRRGVRRLESPEMQAAKQFGGKLFDAVFSDDVRGALRSSIEAAHREDAGLRLRLRLAGAPELVDLPWEFLYNSSLNRFLALSNTTPLVRYIELPETPRPLKISPPLRVLVMISSPSDYEPLDVEREWQKLNDAVRDLSARNMISLERLDVATLGALRRKLRQGQYHVLHFIGHGGFDAQAQDGVLLLEDEQGRGRKTSGQYLGQVLTDHKSLRLVVLNACEGARTARNDPFAGVAQSLVQQGMSAVIAMQFEVTDEASITFAHEFYAAVSDGYPVDAALGEARGAIFSEVSDLEWGTPVLYLRAPDGMIFAPLSEQERVERERARLAEEQRAREKQQQVEALALAAQTSFHKNDFDAAEKSLATLFALDANNANARELEIKIHAAREQEQARAQVTRTIGPTALPNRNEANPPLRSDVASKGIPSRTALFIGGATILALLLLGGGAFAFGVFSPRNATPTLPLSHTATPIENQVLVPTETVGRTTATFTQSPTATFTLSPTGTALLPSKTPTLVPTSTPSLTNTIVPTRTNTRRPTATHTPTTPPITDTPVPTATEKPEKPDNPTAEPAQPVATDAPEPTSKPPPTRGD